MSETLGLASAAMMSSTTSRNPLADSLPTSTTSTEKKALDTRFSTPPYTAWPTSTSSPAWQRK